LIIIAASALGVIRRPVPAALLVAALVGCASAALGQSTAVTAATTDKPQSRSSEAVGPEASELQGNAAQLFREAKALFAEKQYAKAVPVLQEAAKVAPAEQVIHHYLGYALWKEDRFKDAGQEFERARRLDPKNAYTLYFLGRVFDAQGETNAAIRSYESEFALGAPVYDTYQRLAVAYLRRGEPKQALQMVQRGLQATPWESSLHYQLARIYQQTGHPREAKEEFDATTRLKQSDQASIQKLLDLSVAIQNKNAERVSALRRELLAQTPRDPEIMHSLGLLLGKHGYYTEAAEPLTVAAQMTPQYYDAQYNLGLTLMKLGKPADAEVALKKAVELRPDAFEANSALAVLYVGEGRTQDAIGRLNVARQARPDDPGILALLGDEYLQADDARAAIPLLREAIRLKPDNPNPWHVLIEAYQQQKDFSSALSLASQGAERFPSVGRFQFEIGNQLSNLGRYQEALPSAEQSVQLDGSLVEGHDLVGDIESRRGDYEKALASFERAKVLDPTDLEALRGIAQTLLRLKRYDDAVAAANQAIPIHPREPEFYYDLSQAYVRLGDQEKAAQASAKFQQLHAAQVARQNAEDQRRALRDHGTKP